MTDPPADFWDRVAKQVAELIVAKMAKPVFGDMQELPDAMDTAQRIRAYTAIADSWERPSPEQLHTQQQVRNKAIDAMGDN